jgi:YebC/PmpR family DNA-binding regulatory protein
MEAALAGHSKWSQIKRKKAVNDQKRGQMFTKLIRELTVAAREGGGDPNFNPRLRLGVDAAKAANMPQDNIDRAMQRGTGELEGVTYEEIVYEGYGPGGVALYIETLTDNPKRTVAEVRHLLTKNGGSLGTAGSVAWQFDRRGQIYIEAARHYEEDVLEAALEAGAEDVVQEGNDIIVTTDLASFHQVQEDMRQAGIGVVQAEVAMIAQNEVDVAGRTAEKLVRLMEALDGSDDVQKISSNGNIDEETLARLAE